MSLLLDARKKMELALQQGSSAETQSPRESSQEDLPLRSTSQKNPSTPPLRNDPRAAGQNLFNAKSAPTQTSKRPGIIPIALVSGLVLAAGGGYYVWREISPPPLAQRQNPAPVSATPIAATAVSPAPVVAAPVLKDSPAVPQELSGAILSGTKTKKKSATPRHISTTKLVSAPAAAPAQTEAAEAAEVAQPITFARKQENDAVDPTLLAAYQAYRNGDLGLSSQHYKEVLRNDGKNRDALLGLAAIAQQQSQDALAAFYYKQILTLDPRDPVANAGMTALVGPADAAGTESRLKLLLAQQPQSAALHLALGNHYAEQSRWGDAQQAYFSAYTLEAGNAQIVFNLAVSLDHLGQGKLAAQYYQRALQLDTSENAGFDRAQIQQRINELTAP